MSAGRERNPRGQGNLLRGEILAAVDRLVGDEVRTRPKSLSLREAAREAGIAAPSIYPHFDSKEELVEAAIAEGFAIVVEMMRAAGERCGEHAEATVVLAAQARAYLDFADAHRGYFRLMFSLGPLVEPGVGPTAGAVALSRQWAEATSGLQKDLATRALANEELAQFIWNSVHGQIALSRALRPYETSRDEFEAFVEILIHKVIP